MGRCVPYKYWTEIILQPQDLRATFRMFTRVFWFFVLLETELSTTGGSHPQSQVNRGGLYRECDETGSKRIFRWHRQFSSVNFRLGMPVHDAKRQNSCSPRVWIQRRLAIRKTSCKILPGSRRSYSPGDGKEPPISWTGTKWLDTFLLGGNHGHVSLKDFKGIGKPWSLPGVTSIGKPVCQDVFKAHQTGYKISLCGT